MSNVVCNDSNSTLGKFSLGSLVISPGVRDLIMTRNFEPFCFVGRHLMGDWGDVSEEHKQANEEALKNLNRLWSVFDVLYFDFRMYVITEADRSSTTVILSSEY